MKFQSLLLPCFSLFLGWHGLMAQPSAKLSDLPRYDLDRVPVLYTVGYAHLDTEWRWDYDETVNKFLRSTLDDNFRLFRMFRPYVFTFSGARRYKMMKEYYPVKYDTLKKYVAQNRWFVGGSSVDECDVNIPSPESVIRQILYGNNYFRSEFGKVSVDFLLPDCFGFQASLPSVLAHAGLRGFSTQKLVWGSAVGIPFNIGNWIGPDGKGIVAALNATDYGGRIDPGLDTAKYWVDRVMENGEKYGVYADYRYYGTGDIGGSPAEEDVEHAITASDDPDKKIQVYLTSSDQLFRDLNPEQTSRLPSYSGDLLLTQHSAGSLTSEAYMKRWNRKNELLAQAAEPMACAADWLGGLRYPKESLNQGWWLVLGSQMHDILPGTCIPKAYEYAWNDEVVALNRFAAVMTSSVGGVTRAMDSQSGGICIAVYNPLSFDREDIAEATVDYPDGVPGTLIITDPAGTEVPLQEIARSKTSVSILFPARVPSFGIAFYDLQPAKKSTPLKPELYAGTKFIENEYYKVYLNPSGDVRSIFDKKLNKEILSGPVQLEFLNEHPEYWPAWNMDWADRKNPPAGVVGGPARISLLEEGPVRITYQVEREALGSKFRTRISLATGEAGKRIVFSNTVWWQSQGVSLKAAFPLKAKNKMAAYNEGLGVIDRENNNEKKYEVPSREWFDLTDKSGTFGVSILEDCKFGSDKPNDSTLRLTLLYTPRANFYHDQATQDWGIHDFTFALYSHKGDWRAGRSEFQGRQVNQPLMTFRVPSHPGPLGKTFSMLKAGSPQVDVRAFKKSESGDVYVVRLQELTGREAKQAGVTFPAKITAAWAVDGQERTLGDLPFTGNTISLDFGPWELKSIAVKLAMPVNGLYDPVCTAVPLSYDIDVVTPDVNRSDGDFGGGLTIPAELFPDRMTVDGISFTLGGKAEHQFNAVVCRGQKIPLPKTGNFNKVYLLASAVRDTTGQFRVGDSRETIRIQAFDGDIGQFDRRTWDDLDRVTGIEPGYIKRDEVAWFSTHLHCDTANVAYKYAYLFKYGLNASPASGYLQLPENDAIRIFAVTVAEDPYADAVPMQPLYDDFTGRQKLELHLGPRYVTTDMTPAAEVFPYRKKELDALPVRVTMKDYADIHMPNGVTAVWYSSAEPGTKLSGPVQVPFVNDGMFELLSSDTSGHDWSYDGEGRLVMDLQREIDIDSLHLFTTANTKHGAQRFSIWGKAGGSPSVTGDPKAAGWTFVAEVLPVDLWGNGVICYRVVSKNTNSFRYLMFVSEESGEGTHYFREVDVFEKQK